MAGLGAHHGSCRRSCRGHGSPPSRSSIDPGGHRAGATGVAALPYSSDRHGLLAPVITLETGPGRRRTRDRHGRERGRVGWMVGSAIEGKTRTWRDRPMSTRAPSGGPGAVTQGDLFALRSVTGTALVAATVLASMVGFLDAYMINVAVPAIGRDLHASVTQLQWVLTGYLITVAALLLLAGALADHFGRRRILVVGLVVMLAASLCCAAAPTVGTLIVARFVQGVGGAMVVPSSLAMLNGTLRGP